jgi:energy-coupling factor transporter ATP-binding protein EcfA2
MRGVRLTFKNYRGFTDQEPARLEFGPGLTALLGKNNSGKSSLKLFFYEFRDLFSILLQMEPGQAPGLFPMMQGTPAEVNYPSVIDPVEIFNNTNSRPITIEIEIIDPVVVLETCIEKILLKCDRINPRRWTAEAFKKGGGKIFAPSGYVRKAPNEYYSADVGTFDTVDLAVVLNVFVTARYYGPFRNAINVGKGDYYDLQTGTGFIDLWNNWKTSGIKAQTRAIAKVTEDIRTLFEFGQLEINSSGPLKTLVVGIDNQTYRLAELGSGLAQFVMVLGNAATTQPSLVLIDEPETNLHPSLQIDFLLTLAQYASYGCIFSTHSVGLARSVADRIYSIQKGQNGPIVRPFEQTPNYLQFLGELSFSTFKELGHDTLLLVEGVNDVKVLQQLLRLVKKEHTAVILPLGGNALASGERDVELNELTRLSDRIFAFVDSERHQDGADAALQRLAFAETCKMIGIQVCLTRRRAIENYFTDRAVKAAFGQSFSALTPYQRLADAPNGWGKSDSWKIARQMTLDELRGTDLGEFMEKL